MLPALIAFATALSSSGLEIPDSLRPSGATSPGIRWHGVAKGMMAGGALAGLVVGPVAYMLPRLDAAENDWKCSTRRDSLACQAAQSPLPRWPETLVPVGLGVLAAGFVLHLFTIDDAYDQMKIFALPRADGLQIVMVCRL
jgi:hypothetical protein